MHFTWWIRKHGFYTALENEMKYVGTCDSLAAAGAASNVLKPCDSYLPQYQILDQRITNTQQS